MALLNNESRTNIAFKKLVGKAHTGNATDFFQESTGSQISINLQEIIGEEIPTDPQQAVNDGIVEYVEVELEEISSSNDLAFNAVFPDGRLASTYSGFFTGEGASGGDLVRNYTQVVSQKNNLSGPVQPDHSGGYVYNLKDQNGDSISLGAQEGWTFDPVSGILTTEDPIPELQVSSGNAAGTIELYLFTGRFLNETLSDIADGSTFSGTTNDVPEPTGATRTSGDNIYFTNERVDDRLSEVFTDGTNVDSTYDDANDTFTVNVPNADVQDAVFNNVLDAAQQTLIDVIYDTSTNTVAYNVEANLSNYTNDVGFITGIDIDDGGVDTVANATTLNFGSGISVTDDGNQQVTLEGSSAIAVDDSGTNVVQEADKLNFTSRINAGEDANTAGQVNVAAAADLSLYDNTQNWISGLDIDDDGTDVNTQITTLNFGSDLTVTDDGSGQVTIDGQGFTSSEFETELENLLVGGDGITVDTTTGSETRIDGHIQNTDTGTTSETFLLNSSSVTAAQVLLKSIEDTSNNDGSVLEIRNAGDSAFRDLRVRNITVSGTETVNDTQTISVSDNEIILNDNLSDTDPPFTGQSGVRVNRGTESDSVIEWSESNLYWQIGTDPDDGGTAVEVMAAGKDVTKLDFSSLTTDDISEGSSNFYFSASDAKDAVFGTFNGFSGVLADASNDQTLITVEYDVDGNQQVKYTVQSDLSQYDNSTTGFVGSINASTGNTIASNAETLASANYDTDELPEGASNRYFTDNRAQTAVANALTTNTAAAIDISTSGGNSTIAIDHGNTGGAANNTDTGTVINEITFDSFGHVETVGDVEANLDQLQKLLPSAPELSNAGADTSSQGEDGALSFSSSEPISGVEPVPGSNRNDVFTFAGINADGSFNENFGVVGNNDSGTDITLTGPLNPQVDANDQHDADVFGQATVGRLDLIINQGTPSEVSVTIDLSSTDGTIDQFNGNGTGLSVTTAEPLDFPNNDKTYDNEKQRSGTWTIDQSDLRSGYNEILIRHRDGSGTFSTPGTIIGTSQTIKYVLDDDADVIGFPNAANFTNLTFTGVKNISGVAYHTGASAEYEVSISNVYKNTYSPDAAAIEFPSALQSGVSVPYQPIPELSSGESATKTINVPNDLSVATLEATVDADRLIGESITAQAQIFDPVDLESPQTNANAEITDFDLLVDQVSSGNSALEHNWNDENYRLANDDVLGFDNDLNLNNNWDSTNSLKDSGAASDPGPTGYDDGLQVIDGQIEYPRNVDFSRSGIANAPAGSGLASDDNPDYSVDVTGTRYLYAGFTDDTTGTSDFTLFVNGTGTLIGEGQSFSTGSDQVKISIKLPGLTGWLDINEDFVQGQLSDGDGAYFESNGSNQTIGPSSEIGLTTGNANTANSFDKLYYRVTVPEDWTGEITNIAIDWGATS